MFREGGLSLGLISCCQVFGRSARAGRLALEWRLRTPSIFMLCKASAGVISTLEQISGARAGSARTGLLALKWVVHFLCKFWEGKIYARADWFSRSSGSTVFLCLGARAGLLTLEQIQYFVRGTRTLCFPLERTYRISEGYWTFSSHFLHPHSLSFFSKMPFESFSL